MEELLKTLPVSGPVGVALIVMVLLFLRHLASADRANRAEREALGRRIDTLVDHQMRVNTEALNNVAAATRDQGHQCQQMRDFVRDLALNERKES